jgi:hypothetical protein
LAKARNRSDGKIRNRVRPTCRRMILVWFGFCDKRFPMYNDHMSGALSSRVKTD